MGGRRLEAALPRNPGRSHRIYHRPLGVDTMVKAALRTVAGLIVAVLLSALMVMAAPIASAQEPAPAPIPAAPEGFTLLDEAQRTANDLHEVALLLGDGVRPPAGSTSVESPVDCT